MIPPFCIVCFLIARFRGSEFSLRKYSPCERSAYDALTRGDLIVVFKYRIHFSQVSSGNTCLNQTNEAASVCGYICAIDIISCFPKINYGKCSKICTNNHKNNRVNNILHLEHKRSRQQHNGNHHITTRRVCIYWAHRPAPTTRALLPSNLWGHTCKTPLFQPGKSPRSLRAAAMRTTVCYQMLRLLQLTQRVGWRKMSRLKKPSACAAIQ